MKWRHWAVLIVLLLLNYIIFSTAFTQLAAQRRPGPLATRTPYPTFETVAPTAVAWIVLPTSTPRSTRGPMTPFPTIASPVPIEVTANSEPAATVVISAVDTQPAVTLAPEATNTPAPPTGMPVGETVVHTVARGETLSQIAVAYGVTVEAIVAANNLANPNYIMTGQTLIIPAPGQIPPTATPGPPPTARPKPKPPTPTPTRMPPAPTPAPAAGSFQFTAQLVWDPLVAPNCAGPAIAKQSIIRDAGGNAVNGARVEVNCYDNIWLSHPSGNPGEYDPGHYDFSFGQNVPQDWTCTARVAEMNGQPVASSEVVTIHFDTNDCQPYGTGHQVATLNWTKNW